MWRASWGSVTGAPSEVNLGALPALYMLTRPMYVLGGLLFGISTFRASILPRWAAGLLAFGAVVASAPGLRCSRTRSDGFWRVPMGLALA